MTTIRWYQVTALQSVGAWIDDTQFVVPEDEIYPPGQDRELEQERAISQMDQSKIAASMVVLEELFGYPAGARQRSLDRRHRRKTVRPRGSSSWVTGHGDRRPAGAFGRGGRT